MSDNPSTYQMFTKWYKRKHKRFPIYNETTDGYTAFMAGYIIGRNLMKKQKNKVVKV